MAHRRTSRILALVLTFLAATGCKDPYQDAQTADTIAAYETYLADNPDGRFVFEATARLEQLMLEKAAEDQSLEMYNAYLERFTEGALRERALDEREAVMFAWAKTENTNDAWSTYVDTYTSGYAKHRKFAKRMLDVHKHLGQLDVSETRMERTNLAEDPEGPLNGWLFEVDVTNKGPATITDISLTIAYLDADGKTVGEREWPLVAPFWRIPIEEEHKRPMKAGDTRTWDWSTGDLPDSWDQAVRVFVSKVVLAE